jgi:catechol 2,3-dioxygenase
MGDDGSVAMFTAPLDLRDLLEEPDDETGVAGADIGHVHLKVSDLERAVGFWRDTLGMNLRARYGTEAAFVAAGDYHHHVGLNTWMSRGGPPAPEDALGIERVVLTVPGAEAGALMRDPDQVLVELRPG